MMEWRFALVAVSAAMACLGTMDSLRAQKPDIVSGRIVSVHCDAFLTKHGTQAQVPLQSPRDIGLPLSAGDRVNCARGDYLEVLIFSGSAKIGVSPKPFTVPALPPAPTDAKEDDVIAKELRNYGISGATRGTPTISRILWPTENSAILPEHFMVRWIPFSQKLVLSILSDAKDTTIWGPTQIDAAAGSFQSDTISAALAAYKLKSARPSLVLTIAIANSNDREEVHFSLLGSGEERELSAELEYWAKHSSGVALKLGRGYSFQSHKLFAESADEYDAALSAAPGSPYLLEEAIDANRLAGRTSRLKELQARLSSLPASPGQ